MKNIVIIGSTGSIGTQAIEIINENEDKITLPVNFSFKDNKNNYYFGTSGEFSKNFENGIINDVKILLNQNTF